MRFKVMIMHDPDYNGKLAASDSAAAFSATAVLFL